MAPTIQRYAMTQREKIIEEFYLGMIARVLAAKDDETRMLRQELRRLADYVRGNHVPPESRYRR